jgi:hypothetical protein
MTQAVIIAINFQQRRFKENSQTQSAQLLSSLSCFVDADSNRNLFSDED